MFIGRVYADGDSYTTTSRARHSGSTTGRKLRSTDDVIVADVITFDGDVTTSAAARRRQAGRRRTSLVSATANHRKTSQY